MKTKYSLSSFDKKSHINRTELILKQALKLFIKKGYHQTNFQDIAKATKLSRSTIYFYFNNKIALLKEIFHQSFNEHKTFIDSPTIEKTNSLKELFTEAVKCILKLCSDPNFVSRFKMILEMSLFQPEMANIFLDEEMQPTKDVWLKHCSRLNVDHEKAETVFSLLASYFMHHISYGQLFKDSKNSVFLNFDDYTNNIDHLFL